MKIEIENPLELLKEIIFIVDMSLGIKIPEIENIEKQIHSLIRGDKK